MTSSETFIIIMTNIINYPPKNTHTVADLKFLAQKEMNYYLCVIDYYIAKRNSSPISIEDSEEFNKCVIEYIECLENFGLIEKEVDREMPDFSVTEQKFEEECKFGDFHKNLICDTKLLDFTYGLLQLELTEKLLANITENDDMCEILKNRWNALSTEERSIRIMQYLAVAKVGPCYEALQDWWNDSIVE